MLKQFTLWDTSYPADKCNFFVNKEYRTDFGDPQMCQTTLFFFFSLKPVSERNNKWVFCYMQLRKLVQSTS